MSITVRKAKNMSEYQFDMLQENKKQTSRLEMNFYLCEIDWKNPKWMSYTIMPFVQSFTQSLFEKFPLPNEYTDPLEKIGAPSSFGSVIKPKIGGLESLCVLKVKQNKGDDFKGFKNSEKNIIIPFISEIYTGIFCYNYLRKRLPYYMYTHGYMMCNVPHIYGKNVMSICDKQSSGISHGVVESLVGCRTLLDFLNSVEISTEEKFIVFLRILEASAYARTEFGAIHNDFHVENVLVRTMNSSVDIERVNIKSGKIISREYTSCRHVPIIIDYGMTTFFFNGKNMKYVVDRNDDISRMCSFIDKLVADKKFVSSYSNFDSLEKYYKKGSGTYYYTQDNLQNFLSVHRSRLPLEIKYLRFLNKLDENFISETKEFISIIYQDLDKITEQLQLVTAIKLENVDDSKKYFTTVIDLVFIASKLYLRAVAKTNILKRLMPESKLYDLNKKVEKNYHKILRFLNGIDSFILDLDNDFKLSFDLFKFTRECKEIKKLLPQN